MAPISLFFAFLCCTFRNAIEKCTIYIYIYIYRGFQNTQDQKLNQTSPNTNFFYKHPNTNLEINMAQFYFKVQNNESWAMRTLL